MLIVMVQARTTHLSSWWLSLKHSVLASEAWEAIMLVINLTSSIVLLYAFQVGSLISGDIFHQVPVIRAWSRMW